MNPKRSAAIHVLFLLSAVAGIVFLSGQGCSGVNDLKPALIPLPQQLVWNGEVFKVNGREKRVVQRLVDDLPGVPMNRDEAYMLKVTADSVLLVAETEKGIFRGQQTLRQLTYTQNGHTLMSGCSVTDWPSFAIRGFMQDVGRNYMSLPLLKEQIDVLAAYKFNVFHFHVTDNPGWRLESKKYPQLKDPSSMSRWPGKYYSREEFLELVDYCSARFITLIPELDIPGHCEAFRKAFGISAMSDPRVKPILLDIVDELCGWVPAGKMPYIHLGTDEVWHEHEKPAPDLLPSLVDKVNSNGRRVIVWRPGQLIENDTTSVTQLWSSNGHPAPRHPFLDSRLNYLNHLDPEAGTAQLYFDRICGAPAGDSLRLGGILCCWNDNNLSDEKEILRQNPVYPGLLTYSETSWKGQPAETGEEFLAKFPSDDFPLFMEFRQFEERLIQHRDLYFRGKPFPYIRQGEIEWSLIGPFDNKGDVDMIFPVEEILKKSYKVDGQEFAWKGPYYGGTVHIRHFFGFPSYFDQKAGTVYAYTKIWSPVNQEVGCWIGFHDWSRSGGRRGGPLPRQGQWHKTNPKVWINKREIIPPDWDSPGLSEKTEEIPFSDENYYFREPTRITLEKGWNQVLLKIPQDGTSWKWMFTFVPVEKENENVHEVDGLKFKI